MRQFARVSAAAALCLAAWLWTGTARAQVTITITPNPTAFSAEGQVINYTISAVAAFGQRRYFTITDDRVVGLVCVPALPVTRNSGDAVVCTGTYTITAADVTAGSVTNTTTVESADTDDLTNVETDTAQFTITLSTPRRGTLDRRLVGQFMAHRVNLLALYEPDRPRILRRRPGLLWGDDSAGAPVSFAGSGDADGRFGRVSFETSVSRLARYHSAAAQDELRAAFASAGRTVRGPDFDARWDAWIEGHLYYHRGRSGGSGYDGQFGIVWAGIDYLATPKVLLGVLVQYDHLTENHRSLSATLEGRGTMAGPYLSVSLPHNLFFDLRGAWGISRNRINPDGTSEDRFKTHRWLAMARLTGNWHWQSLRITPQATAIYVAENQRGYVNSLGDPIDVGEVALGRLKAGPEIGYRMAGAGGTILEPHAAIYGVWDFYRIGQVTATGLPGAANRVFAGARLGLMMQTQRDVRVRIAGSYDGIGARDFESIGGQLWISLPLR